MNSASYKWDNPRHFSHFSHPDIAQETMSLAERRSNLGFCPPEPPKSTTAMGWRDFWVNQQMIPDLLWKKDKATNTFFLLEILPQMIKICNKMKQPNGNLGASAICWTASKLTVGKAPCGKRVKNDMAPAVWSNMSIWFDLNYVDPESISDIISSTIVQVHIKITVVEWT